MPSNANALSHVTFRAPFLAVPCFRCPRRSSSATCERRAPSPSFRKQSAWTSSTWRPEWWWGNRWTRPTCPPWRNQSFPPTLLALRWVASGGTPVLIGRHVGKKEIAEVTFVLSQALSICLSSLFSILIMMINVLNFYLSYYWFLQLFKILILSLLYQHIYNYYVINRIKYPIFDIALVSHCLPGLSKVSYQAFFYKQMKKGSELLCRGKRRLKTRQRLNARRGWRLVLICAPSMVTSLSLKLVPVISAAVLSIRIMSFTRCKSSANKALCPPSRPSGSLSIPLFACCTSSFANKSPLCRLCLHF